MDGERTADSTGNSRKGCLIIILAIILIPLLAIALFYGACALISSGL